MRKGQHKNVSAPPKKLGQYMPVNEPCMLTTKLRLVQSVVKGDLARSENRKVRISPDCLGCRLLPVVARLFRVFGRHPIAGTRCMNRRLFHRTGLGLTSRVFCKGHTCARVHCTVSWLLDVKETRKKKNEKKKK